MLSGRFREGPGARLGTPAPKLCSTRFPPGHRADEAVGPSGPLPHRWWRHGGTERAEQQVHCGRWVGHRYPSCRSENTCQEALVGRLMTTYHLQGCPYGLTARRSPVPSSCLRSSTSSPGAGATRKSGLMNAALLGSRHLGALSVAHRSRALPQRSYTPYGGRPLWDLDPSTRSPGSRWMMRSAGSGSGRVRAASGWDRPADIRCPRPRGSRPRGSRPRVERGPGRGSGKPGADGASPVAGHELSDA